MSDLLELLTLEDLSGNDLDLATLVGIDGFKNLVRTYGGTSKLYVPKADMVAIPVRDTLIKREYNGYNTYELAIKWGLSERYIQDKVKEETKKIKAQPTEGQTSLF